MCGKCVCIYAIEGTHALTHDPTMSVCTHLACAVQHAKSYSSGCVVSACTTGWRVSDDKSKCLANVCVCSNGVASSGEKCASDGGKMCDSCGDGFKLTRDKTACEGMYVPRGSGEAFVFLIYKYCTCVLCVAKAFAYTRLIKHTHTHTHMLWHMNRL